MTVNASLKDSYIQEVKPRFDQLLADSHILYVMTLNCHWNVEGSGFGFLHALFKGQYEAVSRNVDDLAERVRTLGEKVRGSLAAFSENGSLSEITRDLNADDMIRVLNEAHEHMIENFRDHISFCESNQDFGSADLLTSQLRYYEKTAWVLRSHL